MDGDPVAVGRERPGDGPAEPSGGAADEDAAACVGQLHRDAFRSGTDRTVRHSAGTARGMGAAGPPKRSEPESEPPFGRFCITPDIDPVRESSEPIKNASIVRSFRTSLVPASRESG
ncbi:hypothetical protein Shyd_67180 [Streptomyces hydrogenans]|uniref:Uncharacterized protein n=1 Tax=Streptomyces hydrogenans TaxID=1873719 RepID=A0ABQ3PK06_9ACTN|nr:hypothetical protein GCM10018784_77390 [Streptomyces hydrogenans]GHI25347.1 hypothetical protein Shyd_67180 [Streptomyces hydrogenans]